VGIGILRCLAENVGRSRRSRSLSAVVTFTEPPIGRAIRPPTPNKGCHGQT